MILTQTCLPLITQQDYDLMLGNISRKPKATLFSKKKFTLNEFHLPEGKKKLNNLAIR